MHYHEGVWDTPLQRNSSRNFSIRCIQLSKFIILSYATVQVGLAICELSKIWKFPFSLCSSLIKERKRHENKTEIHRGGKYSSTKAVNAVFGNAINDPNGVTEEQNSEWITMQTEKSSKRYEFIERKKKNLLKGQHPSPESAGCFK